LLQKYDQIENPRLYGHHDLVNRHGIAVSQMITAMLNLS